MRQRTSLSDALQKPVREQSGLNAAINDPMTSQNCKFREVWLTAFETASQHSSAFFQFERPLLSSASNACFGLWCSCAMKIEGRCLSQLRHATASTRAGRSLPWHPLTSTTSTHACTHTCAPGKGWHHETWVQSKQCSHFPENARSQRGVLCSPTKPTLLWTLWCLIWEKFASRPRPHDEHSLPFDCLYFSRYQS